MQVSNSTTMEGGREEGAGAGPSTSMEDATMFAQPTVVLRREECADALRRYDDEMSVDSTASRRATSGARKRKPGDTGCVLPDPTCSKTKKRGITPPAWNTRARKPSADGLKVNEDTDVEPDSLEFPQEDVVANVEDTDWCLEDLSSNEEAGNLLWEAMSKKCLSRNSPPKGKKEEEKGEGGIKKGKGQKLLRSRREGLVRTQRSSSGSSGRGRGSSSRGRGSSSLGRDGSPSKGPYTGLRAAKRRAEEAEAELRDLREIQSILDLASDLSVSLKAKMRKRVEEIQEAVEDVPTPDVAARALENIKRVLKVSTASRGLKGSLQSSLREAAAGLSAMLSLLAKRAQLSPEERMQEEMRALREELRVSQTQVAQA